MNVNLFVSKARLMFNELSKHKIVIGNQAADIDSIVSAICMSFYLTNTNNNENKSAEFIPVINSSRQILKSKRECMYLLDYFSIDFNDLVFINDFNESNKQVVDVTLVDHNELDDQERLNGFESLCTRVIDHHLDKNNFLNATPRLINTQVGSNASLVANLFKSANLDLLNKSFASMLIFPILFDTNKLTTRASPLDHEMFNYLKSIANFVDWDSIYLKLDEIRFSSNDENEETHVLLSKDFKQYTPINNIKWAMSSVNCEVNGLAENSQRLNDIFAFMDEKNLDFFGILSIFKNKNGDLSRDMGLFSKQANLIECLEEKKNLNLTLVKINLSDDVSYSMYRVSDVILTRKHWQPYLDEYLRSI